MTTITQLFAEDNIQFGQNIPEQVNAYLQQAAKNYDNTALAEQLLWQAQQLKPQQLEVYIALYKFYFYQARLEEAEQVAHQALNMCAQVGNFNPDWTQLTAHCANWSNPNLAERIYLYTLKALGFIRLRRLDFETGQHILQKLQELDKLDLVGGSVILDVLSGMKEEME